MSTDVSWIAEESERERAANIPQWCEACSVGMVSHHTWDTISTAEREEMKADGWKCHGRGALCSTCYSRAKRGRLEAMMAG